MYSSCAFDQRDANVSRRMLVQKRSETSYRGGTWESGCVAKPKCLTLVTLIIGELKPSYIRSISAKSSHAILLQTNFASNMSSIINAAMQN